MPEILAIQVQEIESVNRELAPLITESSFKQPEKVRRTVRPREAQLGINHCGMGRDVP